MTPIWASLDDYIPDDPWTMTSPMTSGHPWSWIFRIPLEYMPPWPTPSDIILPEMVWDFVLRYCCRAIRILQHIYSIYLSGAKWLLWKFAGRKDILQTPCVWGNNSFANKISNGLWVQVESQLHTIRVAVQTLLCPKQSLYTAGH